MVNFDYFNEEKMKLNSFYQYYDKYNEIILNNKERDNSKFIRMSDKLSQWLIQANRKL